MTTDLTTRDATEHTQALFRQLFLASPDAIVVTAVNGHISAVNPAAEQLFGYSETELIGNLVEMLIPDRFRGHHPQHREAYVAAPSARPMGTGLELYGLRKDGTEFPVDIMLSPVESKRRTIGLDGYPGYYGPQTGGDSPSPQRGAISPAGGRRQ